MSELASKIGPRSYRHPAGLRCAAEYVEAMLGRMVRDGVRLSSPPAVPGLIAEEEIDDKSRSDPPCACAKEWNQTLALEGPWWEPGTFRNIELKVEGENREHSREAIVVGAYYDSDACESRGRTPGADDNASGGALLIELATRIAKRPQRVSRTVRFVAFTNEEEPFFWTEQMGSRKYARDVTGEANERVVAMLSLETLGYYRDEPRTQDVDWYVRPFVRRIDAGNFLAVVGDPGSYSLVRRVHRLFRHHVAFPANGLVARGTFPGIGWSDHLVLAGTRARRDGHRHGTEPEPLLPQGL